MSDPIIDWLEYMRGIENGNLVPTLEHLKAVCKAAREDHDALVEALRRIEQFNGGQIRSPMQDIAKDALAHVGSGKYGRRG